MLRNLHVVNTTAEEKIVLIIWFGFPFECRPREQFMLRFNQSRSTSDDRRSNVCSRSRWNVYWTWTAWFWRLWKDIRAARTCNSSTHTHTNTRAQHPFTNTGDTFWAKAFVIIEADDDDNQSLLSLSPANLHSNILADRKHWLMFTHWTQKNIWKIYR